MPRQFLSMTYLTRKRVGPVLWNPGHLHNLMIGDFDRDGDLELVATGLNNGYDRASIFSLDLENFTKTCAVPSIPEYSFTNLEIAQLNHYVLLPKSDYTKYLNLRFNPVPIGSLSYHSVNKKFNFTTLEGHVQSKIGGTINYWISGDLKNFDVFISDALPLVRDPLVKSGIT